MEEFADMERYPRWAYNYGWIGTLSDGPTLNEWSYRWVPKIQTHSFHLLLFLGLGLDVGVLLLARKAHQLVVDSLLTSREAFGQYYTLYNRYIILFTPYYSG